MSIQSEKSLASAWLGRFLLAIITTMEQHYYMGLGLRLGAAVLDIIFLFVVLLLPALLLVLTHDSSKELFELINGLAMVSTPLIFLYYFVVVLAKKTTTIGTWLMSHRVVDFATGKPMSYSQALIRQLAMWVSFIPLGLGYFWVFFDKHKRTWHDKLSGTMVISDASYGASDSDVPVTHLEQGLKTN